jgi:glycosyltransferase involved in cell wall biosynthesis
MLADQLSRRGIEVAVATGAVSGRQPNTPYPVFELRNLGLKRILGVYENGSATVRMKFQRHLRSEVAMVAQSFSPTVVHVHDGHVRGSEIPNALFAATPLVPVMNTIHAGQSLDVSSANSARNALLPWDAHVTVSDALYERLPSSIPKVTIPPGINGTLFHSRPQESDAKSVVRGMSDHWVMIPSQPADVKGHDIGRRAFRRVLQRFPDARLLTCESTGHVSPERQRFANAFIADLENDGILDAVTFGTFDHSNFPAAFRSLAWRGLLWHPSKFEGLPTALLEAQACGAVSIATDIDGQREAIGMGAGVLVPPEDPDALAEATIDLFEHPARMVAMSRRAATFAATFDIAWQISKMVNVYEQLSAQEFPRRFFLERSLPDGGSPSLELAGMGIG